MCTLIFITDHAVNEQAGSLHIIHKLIISNRKWYSNVNHNLFQLKIFSQIAQTMATEQ